MTSPRVTRRFYLGAPGPAARVGPGTVLSSTTMRCEQPAISWDQWASGRGTQTPAVAGSAGGLSFVDISLDGQVPVPALAPRARQGH